MTRPSMRLLLVLFAALSGSSCGPKSKCGPDTAVVSEVIDGDTLVLQDGTKLRLLLVDAPETTKGHHDCYGQQAASFTTSTALGKTVQLAYDDAACLDRYGRTLAYVSVDGVEINTALAQQGLACFLYIAPGGKARSDELKGYVVEAQTNRTGMWGACTSIPCSQ